MLLDREAFLPGAHVEGLRDGEFVSWPLDQYCTLFPGRPAADEAVAAVGRGQVVAGGAWWTSGEGTGRPSGATRKR